MAAFDPADILRIRGEWQQLIDDYDHDRANLEARRALNLRSVCLSMYGAFMALAHAVDDPVDYFDRRKADQEVYDAARKTLLHRRRAWKPLGEEAEDEPPFRIAQRAAILCLSVFDMFPNPTPSKEVLHPFRDIVTEGGIDYDDIPDLIAWAMIDGTMVFAGTLLASDLDDPLSSKTFR